MTPVEQPLAQLAAATEELLALLQRRDPRYLEAMERRARLLDCVLPLCQSGQVTPLARAALERIRQLGDACEREALALRRETADALAALDPHLRLADSLGRLAEAQHSTLLDLRA